MKLVAACSFGLEKPLKWELEKLGYVPKVSTPGRVAFEGDWVDVCRANLWLRVADRVLIEILTFDSPDFDALFDTVKEFSWKQWLPIDASFPVNARSRHSQLTSVPAIQRSVKKAIVESLLAGYQTQSLPETGAEFRIEAELLNDRATITLDTTGPSLHKRGYRMMFGEAPIKETLAAAMVMLSVWNGHRPLVDPFCGSGTIAIEAAMIARNIAPGRHRSFLWEHWPQAESVDRAQHLQIDVDDPNIIAAGEPLQISATDIDEQALKAGRRNALAAGVQDDIHFQQRSFEDLRSKRQFGCVITNPPYGQRMSQRRDLLPLYQSFPGVLQRLPTWSHFIITDFPKFEGLLHKSATRRRKLYNGRIECMYYQFLGPRPDSGDIVKPQPEDRSTENQSLGQQQDVEHAVDETSSAESSPLAKAPTSAAAAASTAVFGGLTDKDHEQALLFSTRLKKRSRHFRRWPTKQNVTCYRLYEKDIPELPFVVDRYEDCFHVTEYDRPHDRDPGRHAAWLELMKKTVAKTFEVPINRVYFKTRLRQSGMRQHEKVAQSQQQMTVNERGLKFLVNLKDYVDTGLFLDHRETRSMIRSQAAGKHFLNLFAYTGSFSVYAAAGDAQTTTTVDWSNTYLEWARENMQLNQFDQTQHQFVRSDAMEFLQGLRETQQFDLVVVDPPTFSNSKRTEDVWDVQDNHADLLKTLANNVTTGGAVYFSTNFRRFKLDPSLENLFDVRDISKQTVPEDFRNKRIHQCWRLVRK